MKSQLTFILKNIFLFVFFLILSILNFHLFNYLNNNFFHLETSYHDDLSKKQMFYVAVFVAPLIETVIFQTGLYLILDELFKIKNSLTCIIIMSVAFAAQHYYNWLYIVATFFGGLILNTFYVIFNKKVPGYSYCFTVLLHALYNLYGILFIDSP
ncbi:CPBP family intramembrane glutamic endopeptidase [Chryseobacterium paridis]|uniref:CPBP family intramembrane metalloprotease n=1 Tax=Chryseobacterium paridis TaxID=2800328 RepID=A0ABS1FYE6_9FLAO|nr:CPBP family intramembrane glutamic endopeptidase [Chryseobacterium paridis]MBK1897199.1 CPBP family intramembrane metalloprotease [Chryseobacterium paridis]